MRKEKRQMNPGTRRYLVVQTIRSHPTSLTKREAEVCREFFPLSLSRGGKERAVSSARARARSRVRDSSWSSLNVKHPVELHANPQVNHVNCNVTTKDVVKSISRASSRKGNAQERSINSPIWLQWRYARPLRHWTSLEVDKTIGGLEGKDELDRNLTSEPRLRINDSVGHQLTTRLISRGKSRWAEIDPRQRRRVIFRIYIRIFGFFKYLVIWLKRKIEETWLSAKSNRGS